jgi:hypothetical protein
MQIGPVTANKNNDKHPTHVPHKTDILLEKMKLNSRYVKM